MYILENNDEWNNIHLKDLWVYNKLFLSRMLGYICGPIGTTVPKPDFYIVRPNINLLGMSRYARKEWITKYTDKHHPSEFWCEIFEGEHLSVDFYHKESKLVVLGERDDDSPLYKWKRWSKIDLKIEYPKILNDLHGTYDWINCEFIGKNLIEVHFRQNPDFRYGNSVAIPVWGEEQEDIPTDYTYVSDPDFNRRGFFIDNGIEPRKKF